MQPMTMDKEPRLQQQQSQLSLCQALSMSLLRGGLNQPGSSMPRMQPVARMSRDEQRAHLLSTIELALAVMSDVDDASIFASYNDNDNGQAHQ
jgi:hypothetical protein